MRRVELFEAWAGEKSKSNPLATSIISEFDKWGVNWVDVTTERRRGHGGVAMMIPYDEIIKFLASDYFSGKVFADLKPERKETIQFARGVKKPEKISISERWSDKKHSGPTFVIMASGKIRQWLYDYGQVSSNDNVDIDPASDSEVAVGTEKFFSFLAGHIEHIVLRQFTEQSTLEDLTGLSDSQLKKSSLVDSIINRYRNSEPIELFDRLIQLNRRDDSVLYRILVSINLTDEQYRKIFNILDTNHTNRDELWGAFAKAKTAPRKLRLEALIRIEREYELTQVFKAVDDITKKELMDLYFDDRASDTFRRLAKSHPNFGDIIGDEGGILSDW
jgi:hypothetical protein